MSVNIPAHYVQQFATNIQMLLQQKGSVLRGCVMEGSHIGEAASPVDQVGTVEMQAVTGRFNAMGRVDAPLDRRWCHPSDFDLPQQIDKFDKLRLLTDPNSVYVKNAVQAAGRQMDRLIISALTGTAKTGKTGTTDTVLPTAQKVLVGFGSSGDSGMTVAKLREAKRLLLTAEVEEDEEIYCAMTATQLDNLLAEAQVVSTDFNDRPVLVDGKLTRFLGINFKRTNLVATVAGDRICPVWAKSGAYLGLWNDITTDISPRPDLQGIPWQSYVYMTAGATRLEEGKVVQIACNI